MSERCCYHEASRPACTAPATQGLMFDGLTGAPLPPTGALVTFCADHALLVTQAYQERWQAARVAPKAPRQAVRCAVCAGPLTAAETSEEPLQVEGHAVGVVCGACRQASTEEVMEAPRLPVKKAKKGTKRGSGPTEENTSDGTR